MTDIVQKDLTLGNEVKWYAGGVITHDTETGSASVTLSGKADYGLIVCTVNDVVTPFTATGSESAGISALTVGGTVGETDVVDIYYVDIESSTLKHIASSTGFKTSSKQDTSKKAVDGQKNKITIKGATEHSGSFSQLFVTAEILALFFGDRVTGPGSSEHIWTSKITSFKNDIGCLVGKRYNSSGDVTKKYCLINPTLSQADMDMPTEGEYTNSLNLDFDYHIIYEAAAS